MNVVENDVKELSKKYCKKEKLIKIMIEKSLELGYNENDTINNIIEFMELTLSTICQPCINDNKIH